MKLFDKIKNYFYDEDEPISPKKETQMVKAEPEPISERKKEDKETEKINVDAISERELFKSDPTFNFPIIFDDDDFKDEKVSNTRINNTVIEQTKTVETIEQRVFKPSPNISPVYGIIEIETKTTISNKKNDANLLNLYDEKKKIDIDDVLGKIYEQKRVEVKKEIYTDIRPADETPVIEKVEPKEEPTFDFFNGITTESASVSNSPKPSITEEKAELEVTREETKRVDEKLKSIDELLNNTDEDDFYSLVDSMYKDTDEEGDN